MRWTPMVAGLLLVAMGVACFNYTRPGNVPHHRAWARDRGLPGPTDAVVWVGAGSLGIGAFLLGRSGRTRDRGRSR